jgi:hypothetical protein
MLSTATELMKRRVRATDGEAGRIEDVLFDDERWGVRYLVVDTGDWLASRKVLLSPASGVRGEGGTDPIRVNLTRRRIEGSPDADTDKPVSRRYEAAHAMHYGYPHYWSGPFLWGAGIYPGVIPLAASADEASATIDTEEAARIEEEKAAESHLRSAREVIGYGIEATMVMPARWTIRRRHGHLGHRPAHCRCAQVVAGRPGAHHAGQGVGHRLAAPDAALARCGARWPRTGA